MVSVGLFAIDLYINTVIIFMRDQSIQKLDAAIHFWFISKLDTPCGIYTAEMFCENTSDHLKWVIDAPLLDLKFQGRWCYVDGCLF